MYVKSSYRIAMASGSDQATNDVISVDNTFHPLDVTQRTDGDAEADWER